MTTTVDTRTAAFAKLREPFPAENISKLPKVNCSQCTQAGRNGGGTCSKHAKVKCKDCGNWITSGHIHLDYVGHAETTARLLDADPEWTWEPMATTPEGLPLFDNLGGLWIRLTIGGVTRIGYGSANGKTGPDAIKEVIGDALRNGGMRFGVALDLWAKTDLHANDRTEEAEPEPVERPAQRQRPQAPVEDEWTTPAPSGQLPPPSPLVPTVSDEQLGVIAKLLGAKRGVFNGDRNRVLAELLHRPIEDVRTMSTAEARGVIAILTAEPDRTPPAEQLPAAATAAGTPDNPGITDAQQRMMQSLLKQQGHTRDGAHALMSRVTGRTITSSKQLSKDDANKVISALTTGEVPPAPAPSGRTARDDAFTDLDSIIANVSDPQSHTDADAAITEELAAGRINTNDADLLRERLAARVPQGVPA